MFVDRLTLYGSLNSNVYSFLKKIAVNHLILKEEYILNSLDYIETNILEFPNLSGLLSLTIGQHAIDLKNFDIEKLPSTTFIKCFIENKIKDKKIKYLDCQFE